jgi:hypothetical protein
MRIKALLKNKDGKLKQDLKLRGPRKKKIISYVQTLNLEISALLHPNKNHKAKRQVLSARTTSSPVKLLQM